jgi:hypothetical protein
MALESLVGPWPHFQFLNPYTVDRTPWTAGRKAATYTQNKHTDIHASNGIRTHDPSVRASEDNSWLRPRGHCDRLPYTLQFTNP